MLFDWRIAQPVPTGAVEARLAGYVVHSSKREQDWEKKFRAWFKNQIYAPGAYTGYGAKPIAAVREYMDQEKWKEAGAQVPMVCEMLEKAAGRWGSEHFVQNGGRFPIRTGKDETLRSGCGDDGRRSGVGATDAE